MTGVDRFLDKFTAQAYGCWEWLAGKDADGYGQFHWPHGSKAHRFSYELYIGPIPDGLTIDHLCRNRSCVNPSHLEAVTHAENMRRGRGMKGQGINTHCPKGHPYDEANTYQHQSERQYHRTCRACNLIAVKAYQSRKKASSE